MYKLDLSWLYLRNLMQRGKQALFLSLNFQLHIGNQFTQGFIQMYVKTMGLLVGFILKKLIPTPHFLTIRGISHVYMVKPLSISVQSNLNLDVGVNKIKPKTRLLA